MTYVLPLYKADAERRLVFARAAMEEPDKSREIMDYSSARPQFETWSKQYSDATLGKSLGNIRAMHNPRHLAGKVQDLVFDDASKTVDVCIKVLDPVDWTKVEEGGYTGLSIGGGYLKKWTDPADPTLTRYTPRIAEISLVDSPCIPSARILELQKSDGETVQVMLKGVPRVFADMQPPRTFDDLQKKTTKPRPTVAGSVARGLGAGFAGITAGSAAMGAGVPPLASVVVAGTGSAAGHHVGAAFHRHVLRGRGTPISRQRSEEIEARSTLGGILAASPLIAYGAHRFMRRQMRGKPPTIREDLSHGLKLGRYHAKRGLTSLKTSARRGLTGLDRTVEHATRVAPKLEPELAGRATARAGRASLLGRLAPKAMRLFRKSELDFGPLLAKLEKGLFGHGAAGLALGLGAGAASSVLRGRKPPPEHGVAHHVFWTAASGLTPYVGYRLGRSLTSKAPKKPKLTAAKSELDFGPLLAKLELDKAATAGEREKIHQTMHEFKHGQLHSFRPGMSKKKMPKVTDRRQAVAIALSQARRLGKQHDSAVFDQILRKLDRTPDDETDQMPSGHAANPHPTGSIEAIKHRWLQDGHADLDAHFGTMMDHADRASLGHAEKIAAVTDQRDGAWRAIGEAHAAYDHVRKYMPDDHHLMMEVPHMAGLLYNPEHVGNEHFDHSGKAKHPITLLHPTEASDWVDRHGKRISKQAPVGLVTDIRQITDRVATA